MLSISFYQAQVRDIDSYNKVQQIEILWVVNNLFETMIHVNLKGRLMNFNEDQDENIINPVVIIAS